MLKVQAAGGYAALPREESEEVIRVAVIISAVLFASCTRPAARPEGYKVISYDGAKGQWTVLRSGTWEGEYRVRRLTLQCYSYTWGSREPSFGEGSCSLVVGRLYASNVFSERGKGPSRIDVTEMPARLVFQEGEGDDMVRQSFVIVKDELLSAEK